MRYPVYRPDLSGNEKAYVSECLDSSWISSRGDFIKRFEAAFADYVATPHATSVCNGTVALHLALMAAGIGPGDEVIVPTLTYVASVNAIAMVGAVPVFVDSDPQTWQMDVADVDDKLTTGTRAVMAVHLYGQACDIAALRELCDRRNLRLVEDCAEAFGTLVDGRHVGTFGDVATFSFFGNKTITTGEGGMVVSRDDELAAKAVLLKNQGLSSQREYWHEVIGYNYRMTNVAAAIGLAQLERADDILARKRQLATWYRQGLQGLPVSVHEERPGTRHSYWMCSLLVHESARRGPLRDFLHRNGVETRPLFNLAHTMPMYRDLAPDGRFPVASRLAACGMNLPSYPALAQEDVSAICGFIRRFFDEEA